MEVWKDIKGYEGLYQVSNYGRVRSLNYLRKGEIRCLRAATTKKGYKEVRLWKDGCGKMKKVHRLVAEAFIPNPYNLPQVNHKDENKQNNFAGTPENDFTDGNLEWCDNKYNSCYGTRNERVAEKNKNGKRSKPIKQYSLYGDYIRDWVSASEVERELGFFQGSISSCCRFERKQAYGYIWRYKEKKEVV